jgi:hypothetical protein
MKFKINIVAIIAAIAMFGTVGNTCFNLWEYFQRERVLLDVICEPIVGEPAYFRQIDTRGIVMEPNDNKSDGSIEQMDICSEMLTFFAKCFVTNIGSKKVCITSVFALARLLDYSKVGVGGDIICNPWGSGGGHPSSWPAPSFKFAPNESETVYQYDEGTKNLKPFTLPMAVEAGEQVIFYVKVNLLIGQDMTKKFNTTCSDRLKRKITLLQVFEDCMNGKVGPCVYEGYGYSDFRIIPPKDVLYKITPIVSICTTGGFDFDAKTLTIYIVKKN